MKTVVERRRLRTWEADTDARPEEGWRIVFRYGLLRHVRAWWVVLPAVGAVVATVIALGVLTSEIPYGAHSSLATGMASMALMQGVVFLFLVGTPLLAEDMRFHAPLFYFSKPLPVAQYVRGKVTLLAAFLVAFAFVPLVLVLLLGAILGPGATEPQYYFGPPGEWEATHLDTVGDWILAAAFLLPGMLVVLAFLAAVTVAISAYTRRAWHAAMGLVAILGGWTLLGAVAAELIRNAFQNVFSPGGWIYLVLSVPLEVAFRHGATPRSLQGAPGAIGLAYVLLIATTLLAAWLTKRRLAEQEAIL